MSLTSNYAMQIYKTYEHIQKGSWEILRERGLYDPIQDYYLEKGLEKTIKFAHQADTITSGYEGLHGLMHQIPLPFGLTVHTPGIKLFTLAMGLNIHLLGIKSQKSFTISIPGVEIFLHLGFNALATVTFILMYPALNSSYIESFPSEVKYIVTESSRFFGIGPLEIMHSAKYSAKSILGENSAIGEKIEYLSYGENYNEYRANDDGYKQAMHCYTR